MKYEEKIDKEIELIKSTMHPSLFKYVFNDPDIPYKWNKFLQDKAYIYKLYETNSHIEAHKAAAECEEYNFKSWYNSAIIKQIRYKELRLKLFELKRTYYRLYVDYYLSCVDENLGQLHTTIFSFISLNISQEGKYITDDVEINNTVMYIQSEFMKLEKVNIEISKILNIQLFEYTQELDYYLHTLLINDHILEDIIHRNRVILSNNGRSREDKNNDKYILINYMKLEVMINILKELGLIGEASNNLRNYLTTFIIGADDILRVHVRKLIMYIKLEEIINILKELNVIPIGETSFELRYYVHKLIMDAETSPEYEFVFFKELNI